MKRKVALVLSLLLIAGCSRTPALKSPDLVVRLAGGFPAFRSGMEVPLNFDIYIRNNSSEPISLEQIRLESYSSMSFAINMRTTYFKQTIAPGESTKVPVFATARILSSRTARSEPMTVRVTANFNSPVGRFQRVYIRDTGSSVEGPRSRE